MSADIPDLPENPLSYETSEPASEEKPPEPDRKLHFRAWLWLQLNTQTKFRNLAKLILSGGPDGIWVNKPLQPEYVLKDIEQFYATARQGVNAEMVEQMRAAVKQFRENPESTQKLVEAKLRGGDKTQSKRLLERIVEVAENTMSDDTDESAAAAGDFKAQPKDTDRPLTSVDRKNPFEHGTLIPKVRCKYTNRTRHVAWQCARNAVIGHEMCEIHGGSLIDPEEIKNLLRAGQERLILASDTAISTVVDIMENGVNEATRLKAAEMVLDRTGFQPGIEITIGGQSAGGPSNADILRDRLLALAGHQDIGEITATAVKDKDEDDENTEDAEVVTD